MAAQADGHPFLAVHVEAVHRRGIHLVRLRLSSRRASRRSSEPRRSSRSQPASRGSLLFFGPPPRPHVRSHGCPNWFINVCGDGAPRARKQRAARAQQTLAYTILPQEGEKSIRPANDQPSRKRMRPFFPLPRAFHHSKRTLQKDGACPARKPPRSCRHPAKRLRWPCSDPTGTLPVPSRIPPRFQRRPGKCPAGIRRVSNGFLARFERLSGGFPARLGRRASFADRMGVS